ncbi:hypothetical protein CA12_05410 [Alienimonas californiensis]|uniref:Secreted protein n=2 Tax=Alienimonas californiensis TaxID=2527989 RepID=A0A517P511_9PLAN|nr:hypothetical protein CA12_05410 [Alienimonas californiensis]
MTMSLFRSLRCVLAIAAVCSAGMLSGCGGVGEVSEQESIERQAEMETEVQARDAEPR